MSSVDSPLCVLMSDVFGTVHENAIRTSFGLAHYRRIHANFFFILPMPVIPSYLL